MLLRKELFSREEEMKKLEQELNCYPPTVLTQKLEVADQKDFFYFTKYIKILSKLKKPKSFRMINIYIDNTTTYQETLERLQRIYHYDKNLK